MAILQVCFWMLLPALAGAHSVDELNEKLLASEKFFQPIDKPAPKFALLDQDGDPVNLADFEGKVVVLYFAYLSCPDTCPLQTDFIGELQQMINATPMRDLVEFVTVTTDPLNDTYADMQKFGPERGLDPYNWRILTSGPDLPEATRDLVEQFGHSYQVVDDGYQVHGTVTHVIDKRGQWRANFYGLDFKPTNMVMFVNALVNEHHDDNEDNAPGFLDRVLSIFN
ncbi:MAG: cytochrome-c oxidase [Rhodobacteraceae bacterium]|nr:MAG: cytochrome-c oxidase [Paracoccaceae bacterium]